MYAMSQTHYMQQLKVLLILACPDCAHTHCVYMVEIDIAQQCQFLYSNVLVRIVSPSGAVVVVSKCSHN